MLGSGPLPDANHHVLMITCQEVVVASVFAGLAGSDLSYREGEMDRCRDFRRAAKFRKWFVPLTSSSVP
jgi:hypothetical protein